MNVEEWKVALKVFRLFEIIEVNGAKDEIEHRGVLTVVNRKWEPAREFLFEVAYNFKPKHFMIPGVVYDGNKRGRGIFPRPTLDEPWWFREDRTTVPSMAIVEDDERVLAVFTEPAKTPDEISSVSVSREKIAIRIPWAEEPKAYVSKWRLVRGKRKYFKKPIGYSRKFYIIFANYRELGYERGYYLVFDEVWKLFGRKLNIDWSDVGRKMKFKAQLGVNVMLFRRPGIASFLTTVLPPTGIPIVSTMSAGFVGKSLEIALSLYRIYLLNEQEKLKKIAFEVANFHCKGLRKSGILMTDYNYALKSWFGSYTGLIKTRMVSSRMMGEAGYFLTRLYEYAEREGEGKDLWLRTAERIAEFFIRHQLPNGSFGKWWRVDGKGVVDEGTNGAYALWLLAELYKVTSREKYVEAAMKGAEYYIKEFVERDEYWGDTLDADTIDKEAGHAILRALLLLHKVTGESELLKAAERAAYFTLTWMFHYDVPFDRRSPLGEVGYRTYGVTIVSVENQHADIYGAAIAVDFLRLWKLTRKEEWKERAIAMLWNALQLISTPENRLGVPWLFLGWQPEQINNTNWFYIFPARPWGFFNNISWVIALWMGGFLDAAEILGVKLNVEKVEEYKSLAYKMFKLFRDAFVSVNFFT